MIIASESKSDIKISHITGKPVCGICDHVKLKPVCSATETSWSLEILDLASIGIMMSVQQTTGCAGMQADLHRCCLHMA